MQFNVDRGRYLHLPKIIHSSIGNTKSTPVESAEKMLGVFNIGCRVRKKQSHIK